VRKTRNSEVLKFWCSEVLGHDTAAVNARSNDTQVICGMTVVRKAPDADAKIILPPDRAGAAVRKIEPNVCTSHER